MKLAWARAIRFVSSDGRTLYGDPILPYEDYDLGSLHEGDQIKARVIEGTDLFDESGATRLSSEVVTVSKLLGPLTPTQVPMLRCVGLNYAKHSMSSLLASLISILMAVWLTILFVTTVKEAGRSPPPYPFYFMKPSTTIVGHHDPVIIPKIAQDSQADYEGELVSPLHVSNTCWPANASGSSVSSWARTPRTFPSTTLYHMSAHTPQATTSRLENCKEILLMPVGFLNGASPKALIHSLLLGLVSYLPTSFRILQNCI